MTGGEGEEVVLKAVSAEEGIKGGEVLIETRLEDGTREEGVVFITRGEGAIRATEIEVWEVGGGGVVEVVSRKWAVLTTQTKEGGGPREGGVSPEPQG